MEVIAFLEDEAFALEQFIRHSTRNIDKYLQQLILHTKNRLELLNSIQDETRNIKYDSIQLVEHLTDIQSIQSYLQDANVENKDKVQLVIQHLERELTYLSNHKNQRQSENSNIPNWLNQQYLIYEKHRDQLVELIRN